MNFDVDNITSDLGKYHPDNDDITIYLASIYNDFTRQNKLLEYLLIYTIIDSIIHEQIHKSIDQCIEDDPVLIDDHKIFKFLRGV